MVFFWFEKRGLVCSDQTFFCFFHAANRPEIRHKSLFFAAQKFDIAISRMLAAMSIVLLLLLGLSVVCVVHNLLSYDPANDHFDERPPVDNDFDS